MQSPLNVHEGAREKEGGRESEDKREDGYVSHSILSRVIRVLFNLDYVRKDKQGAGSK